jgi:hypothetical protein
MFIIGVNPPKSCYACSWYNKVECPVKDGRYYYRMQRHPSCPLIELPPHGRLGDLDKLNIHDISPVDGFCVMGVTEEDIELADTVIEAEGET